MSRPSPYGYYNPNQPPPPRHLWQQHPPYPGPPPPPFPPQHGAHFNPYAQPFPGPPPAAHAHPRPPYGPPPALFQPPALPPHMQPPHQLHHLPHQQLPAPHAIHPHQPPPLHLNPHPHDHDQQQQQQPQPLSPAAEDDLTVVPGWVISRWRYDVASAPAVAFSPLSNPPQRIFDDALEYPPAPKPPKQKPRPARRPSLPLAHHPQPEHNDSPGPSPAPAALPSPPKTPPPAPKRELVVESVSVAETTPATSVAPESPTPHSPLSTNTSLSVSPKISQDATPSAPAPLEQPKEEPAPSTSAPAPAEPEPESQPQAVQADVTPTAPTPASPPAPTPAPEVAAPAPAPAKPAKPPVKSWADLMKSNTKGGLPTSSVVGVSIPADAPRSSLANASPAKRAATQAIVQLLSAPAPPVAASSTILPRGLINGGNLCFANAILQALVYCPPFHRLFAEFGRLSASAAFQPTTPQQHQQNKLRGTVGARLGATPTPLVDATINFLDEFAPRSTPAATPSDPSRSRSPTGSAAGADSDAFIPTYIYDALKQKKRFDSMRRGHQEDAEEFLGFYLDTLEEELLALLNELSPAASSSKPPPGPVKSEVVEETASEEAEDGWTEVGKRNRAVVVTNIKTTESPISRVFGGKFRSILRQPGTGRDSVTLQDWNRLQLDIQPPHVLSITDALRNLVAAEPVQVDGKDATKQVQLDTLPRVLVLHLKRFAYDATLPGGGGVVKNGKRIAFEPVLELGNELMVPARRASNPTHIPKYKLSAVVYHHGQSATGGHYTLDVLHPAAGQAAVPWVRLDDDIVTRVRAEDVFGQDGADDKVAYLLFYRPIGNIR